MITTTNTQQTSLQLSAENAQGQRVTVAVASCAITPGRSLSINIDLVDPLAVAEGNREAVGEALRAYIAQELGKAQGLGLVPLTDKTK